MVWKATPGRLACAARRIATPPARPVLNPLSSRRPRLPRPPAAGKRGDAPPPPPPSDLTLTLTAIGASALLASLALAGGESAAAFLSGAPPLTGDALLDDGADLFSPASTFRLGFAAAAGLWTAALRLISLPQLAFLFLGKVDGARPVDGVERLLSLAAGPDGPTTPGQLAAVRAGSLALFSLAGLAVAAGLNAALGDDIWGVATGLGALAAGLLVEAGRAPVRSPAEVEAAAARFEAFSAWADGGAMVRTGQCHESEVVRAAKALGGPAAVPPRWSEEEIRAALRRWAAAGDASPPSRSPPSRSSAGYWKGVSVVPRSATPWK